MPVFNIRLLGRFQLQRDGELLAQLNARKAHELLAYLLLHREHVHVREALADLLWHVNSEAQSMKYLRHALWQLQLVLNPKNDECEGSLLISDHEWIGINPNAQLWLDFEELENALSRIQKIPSQAITESDSQILRDATRLYQGDLLQGFHCEWLVDDRERLRNSYLAILGILMDYAETHHQYQAGFEYGAQILQCDRAHEGTYRQLMRLYYCAGDRTGALRQYERCMAALQEELSVLPSEQTTQLYEQIRSNHVVWPPRRMAPASDEFPQKTLYQSLLRLKQLDSSLGELRDQVGEVIRSVEEALSTQG